MVFSVREMSEMIIIYGECRRNAAAAAALYQERFPNRRVVTTDQLRRVVRRLQTTGQLTARPRARRPRGAGRPEHVQQVLTAVRENPHTSSRAIGSQLQISHQTVLRILKTRGFHPYHMQIHQHLQINDPLRRLEYCNWLDVQLDGHPDFCQRVVWSDEATFGQDGNVNTHNAHYWNTENPHWLREGGDQVRFKVNVWCGIFNYTLIGPVFLPEYLNGQRYLQLLQVHLERFLDDLPLRLLPQVWYQHDGAPPHFSRRVRLFLNDAFPNRWIGRGGPINWPARSPDLNPLDFFFWGFVKSHVYNTRPQNVNDLRQRIVQACNRVTPEMLSAVRRNLRRRLRTCIAVEGGHFEHLLPH